MLAHRGLAALLPTLTALKVPVPIGLGLKVQGIWGRPIFGYTGSDAPPWDSSDTRPWSRPRPEVTRAVSRGSHADFERDMRA